MEGICVHARGMCVDEYDVLPEQAEDLQYDAAAAHALMLAISETHIGGITTSESVFRRADELMKEWGYD